MIIESGDDEPASPRTTKTSTEPPSPSSDWRASGSCSEDSPDIVIPHELSGRTLTAAALLGYRKNGLWWLVGYVNSRRGGRIGHAIALIVLDDGSVYILDNRAQRVIPMSEYFLLDLVYGINTGDREVWMGILVDSRGNPTKAH